MNNSHFTLKNMYQDLLEITCQPFNQEERQKDYQDYSLKLQKLMVWKFRAKDARRIQTRIKNQGTNLITALLHDGVPLTNNAAERQIRPAVVVRKISGGSRSTQGVETFAVNFSLIQTIRMRDQPLISILQNVYSCVLILLMPKSRGFTLIEVLITVTIIAILVVVGIVLYNNMQQGARDTRRRNDIIAIAKAMEVNATTAGSYVGLQATWFVDGTVPLDPYCPTAATCLYSTAGQQDCNPSSADGATCKYCAVQGTAPLTSSLGRTVGCYPGNGTVLAGFPAGGVNSYWRVCANLEGGGFFCKDNLR